MEVQSELLSISEHEAISEYIIILENSDTSVMIDEAEFHYTASWSFTHTNDTYITSSLPFSWLSVKNIEDPSQKQKAALVSISAPNAARRAIRRHCRPRCRPR
ncbi:hypothetical protein BDBG_07908 [Blastomyces gilchristii SLH14081]|uniref:Uncharacterized protein n=1 Tax=Blastomyces gilchristii (strain SLH14081) TaxID=559298 RepID=A0A179UZM9_BLAGS|nr:uncharacterized protein BDBG_07908 [Blastomyces gilchristii SLH14081]OAT12577.1 hypothetical protein BDBG_07908 [Blastomyces gilchristii SLH14081]